MMDQKNFPLLETPRLILREIVIKDASDLYQYYVDREVTKTLNWFGPSSVEHAEKLIAKWRKQFEEDTLLRFGITQKGEDKVIGTIYLEPVMGPFEWQLPVHIGYELSRDYWSKGIMSEAIESVIDYVFNMLQIHRIMAEVFPENMASIKALEKFGFEKEGLLKQHVWHNGTETWHDAVILALLKNQYRKQNVL